MFSLYSEMNGPIEPCIFAIRALKNNCHSNPKH